MKLFEDLPSTKTPFNAENLNQIQDNLVVVSATEPTGENREKVWIQKSKNLLRFLSLATQTINGLTITNNKDGSITLNGTTSAEISLQISDTMKNLKSGNYCLSRNASGSVSNTFTILLYGRNSNAVSICNQTTETHIANATVDYREFYLWLYVGSGRTFDNYVIKPQLEHGLTATEYEEYITPKIYIKNDNDVYEELISKDNLVDYSTVEQKIGTWIDGKPIYRRTKRTTLKNGPNALGKPSSNLDLLVNVYGILRYTKSTDGAERMMSLTRVHYNDINNQIGWFYSGADNNIWVEVGTNYTDEITAYITYEYTKTTD